MVNKTESFIPFRYLPLGLLEAFATLGIETEEILDNAGLKINSPQPRDLMISEKQWQKLIHNALILYPRRHLGFTCGQRVHQSYFGPCAAVLAGGASLLNAYQLYYAFCSLLQPEYIFGNYESSFYFDTNKRLTVIIDNCIGEQDLEPVKIFAIEFQLSFLIRLCRAYGGLKNNRLDIKVHLGPYIASSIVNHIAKLPNITLLNWPHTGISIHTSSLNQIFYILRQDTFQQARRDCLKLLHWHRNPSIVDQVKQQIRETFFITTPNLETVAFRMASTPRALSRKLALENTNFRSILYEMKMDMALNHLKHSRLKTDTIARILKFSNDSSLRRAVKNWRERNINSPNTIEKLGASK